MASYATLLLLVLSLVNGVTCQSSGILTTLAEMESKPDQQQNAQNQILTTQTSLLQAMMEQQTIQNQVLTNVVGLLQKHDEQMSNMNRVQENMSALLSQQQQSQTQMMSNMASSLHNITERLVTMMFNWE